MKTRPDDIRCTACRRHSGEPDLAKLFTGRCDICLTKITGFRVCDFEWRTPWNEWVLSKVSFRPLHGIVSYECEHPRSGGGGAIIMPPNSILIAREENI